MNEKNPNFSVYNHKQSATFPTSKATKGDKEMDKTWKSIKNMAMACIELSAGDGEVTRGHINKAVCFTRNYSPVYFNIHTLTDELMEAYNIK